MIIMDHYFVDAEKEEEDNHYDFVDAEKEEEDNHYDFVDAEKELR